MLEVREVHAGYGKVRVLFGFSLAARPGEVTCLMGRNGAGKTTLMKCVMGLVRPSGGSIVLDGEDISALPAHEIPKRKVGYVPQGRRLFGELTVAENLKVGLMARGLGAAVRDRVLDIFPPLRARLGQPAETLSGGERQMLATARALCVEPSVLLMDEPTEGLQPSMIAQVQDVVERLKSADVAVVVVEQRIEAALAMADKIAFMESGRNLETADASSLREDRAKLERYLGV